MCNRGELRYIPLGTFYSAESAALAYTRSEYGRADATGIMQAAQQTELEAMTDMFNKCAAQELSLPWPFCAPHTTLPVAQDDGPVLSKMCRNVQRA